MAKYRVVLKNVVYCGLIEFVGQSRRFKMISGVEVTGKCIGLRGEEAVSFLSNKRYRPVFKGKNIFFKFFLFMNWAKLNKKFVKKIYFRKKNSKKNN